MNITTPIHQWTHTGDKVLLVKCVGADGQSRGGFQWPKSGSVDPGPCSMEPTCDSGGLFGWAWGLNLGGGRDLDYGGCWIVFASDPQIVVDLGDKQKAAGVCEVVFYGDWASALEFTLQGRLAWITHATGESGAASATGVRGAASATGVRGAASATGEDALIEVTADSLGSVTADKWRWMSRPGAVVACKFWWPPESEWKHQLLFADALGLVDGEIYEIHFGQPVTTEKENVPNAV